MNQNYNRYLNEVNKSFSPMKEEELREFIRIYQTTKSEKAYHKIVNANTKYVISVSHQYKNKGVDIQDLIQAGNLGLHEAIIKFDLNKQTAKFYTYATWWIRRFIFVEINTQSRFMNVAEQDAKNKYTVNKATEKLEQKLFRTPTNEEISEYTGIPINKILQLELLNPQSSLDSVIGHDNSTLKDCIPDQKVNELEIEETSKNISKFIQEAETTKGFDRTVIELTFGMKTGSPLTLQEVGEVMNLSYERIRQLKDRSLEVLKVRNNSQKTQGKFHLV